MATARVPLSEFSSGPININSSLVPNPQGYLLPAGGTITFSNTAPSGAPINITFVPAGVFNNFSIGPGTQNTQTAQIPNGGVSYFINGNMLAPYAIQVGAGSIPAEISAPGGVVTYTPQFAAIPLGGNLVLYGGDQSYHVLWSGGNCPVNPAIGQALQGFSNNAASTGNKPANTYGYSCTPFTVKKPKDAKEVKEMERGDTGNGGGGRIVVRST